MNIASLNLTVPDQAKTTWSRLGTGVGNDTNGDQGSDNFALWHPPAGG